MRSGWYLARTKPMSEYVAAAALEKNGYRHFFPKVQTRRPRVGHDDAPFFPGYIFVHCNEEAGELVPIRLIAGLVGWVHFDDVVPRVPDEVIVELGRRLEEINRNGGRWRQYAPGETVRVISGSVEGFAKVLEEPKSPQARVRVLLSFMDQFVPASVPWQDLQPEREGPFHGGRPPRRTRGRGRWVNGFGPRAAASASPSRS